MGSYSKERKVPLYAWFLTSSELLYWVKHIAEVIIESQVLISGTGHRRSGPWGVGRDWSMGSLEVGQYERLRMDWMLKAKAFCGAAKLSIRFRKAVVKICDQSLIASFWGRPQCVNTNYVVVVLCWVDGSALRRFGVSVVQKVCHVLQRGSAVKAR